MLEHRALHEATAFLSCGGWSAGRHSGHGRLLYKKHLLFSPLRCWKGYELSWPICFRGVLERDCQREASWCCKSFVQFHKWGFLSPWGLQVLCRHNKLFCAWALFPAHFLAESWFSKGCNDVWEVDLTVCLCLWSGWWGGSLWPLLYVLLPLVAWSGDLPVTFCYRKHPLGCTVFDLFYAKQNVLQWYEIKRSRGFFFF